MDTQMSLEIVTPMGSMVEEIVVEVTVPGALGEMGVLPGHIPVLTALNVGELRYLPASGKEETCHMAISGGYLEMDKRRLIVLTEAAEYAAEIDTERAKSARDRAEKELGELEPGSVAYQRRARALKRAENRIAVAASAH